jgi:autotransporter translocation and assembly factor TamB
MAKRERRFHVRNTEPRIPWCMCMCMCSNFQPPMGIANWRRLSIGLWIYGLSNKSLDLGAGAVNCTATVKLHQRPATRDQRDQDQNQNPSQVQVQVQVQVQDPAKMQVPVSVEFHIHVASVQCTVHSAQCKCSTRRVIYNIQHNCIKTIKTKTTITTTTTATAAHSTKPHSNLPTMHVHVHVHAQQPPTANGQCGL